MALDALLILEFEELVIVGSCPVCLVLDKFVVERAVLQRLELRVGEAYVMITSLMEDEEEGLAVIVLVEVILVGCSVSLEKRVAYG